MTDFVTDTHALIWYLQDSPRLSLQDIPRDQVPNMPDRIIAATALQLNLPSSAVTTKFSFQT